MSCWNFEPRRVSMAPAAKPLSDLGYVNAAIARAKTVDTASFVVLKPANAKGTVLGQFTGDL